MRVTANADFENGVERDSDGQICAFRVFARGQIQTDYGTTLFDDQAAAAVMAERAKRGNRFSIDFDHLSIRPDATPEQRRAAGSFDIELRNGELWAVDLRLTREARAWIQEGSYLSISPAYDVNSKTGRVTSLLNVALTSNPATHGAVRLAASRYAKIDSDTLRLLARETKGDVQTEAERELARRGEQVSTDWRIARLREIAGLTAHRGPLVRNEGCRQVFETVTEARRRAAR